MKSEIEIKIEQIRKEFNERLDKLMPKSVEFEVGKWYKLNKDSNIVCFYKNNCDGYGIDSGYNWSDSLLMSDANLWTLATQSEVKEALTNEAVKRGFVEGSNVDGSIFGKEWYTCSKIDGSKYSFDYNLNQLSLGNYAIFKNGKWASIILEKTIDDWAEEFDEYSRKSKKTYSEDFKYFTTEHKFQLPK